MSASDEQAIRDIEHRFNVAWNAHDPDAIAESLADDAQFITVNGAWTTSRSGFRDLMQRLHGASGPFRASTRRSPEMRVTFLTPEIAILHTRFWIKGEVMHDALARRIARASARASFARSTGVGWSSRRRTPMSARPAALGAPRRLAPIGAKGDVMPFKCNEPAVPTIQQDDKAVRITRWDFAPGAATGWHSHGWPYFVVLLTDAVMKIEAAGAVSEVRFKAGQCYQRPAGIEHDVMNASEQPLAFVEIEIKRPDELVQLK